MKLYSEHSSMPCQDYTPPITYITQQPTIPRRAFYIIIICIEQGKADYNQCGLIQPDCLKKWWQAKARVFNTRTKMAEQSDPWSVANDNSADVRRKTWDTRDRKCRNWQNWMQLQQHPKYRKR